MHNFKFLKYTIETSATAEVFLFQIVTLSAVEGLIKQKSTTNERSKNNYNDQPYDDAHDVLLYRYTLLPKAKDLNSFP